MARKFLYIFAVLIVLAIGAAFAYRFFGADLVRMSLTPFGHYQQQAAVAPSAYADRRMWIARPDLPDNPATWTPTGVPRPAAAGPAAVFFVHPTSYLQRSRWNAPLDDPEANVRGELFVRGQASALNGVGEVWAPRYRQAAFGAFLSSGSDAQHALDLAYHDVEVAFAEFVRESGDRPIILAGHSQGSMHLTRLIREHVAGTSLQARVVAAYIVGWPVSRTADLPVMGLPECTSADQAGCLLSWQSFAEPADPALILDTFDATTGFDGQPRRGTAMVCTNPLTGTANAEAPASANLGTLIPNPAMTAATLQAGSVPARCSGRGLLLIGAPPAMGGYVLPGNNYHVYDYSLFWANIRADAARRLATWLASRR